MPADQKSGINADFLKENPRPTVAVLTYNFYDDPNSSSLLSGIADAAVKKGINIISLPAFQNSPEIFEAKTNVLYNLISKRNINGIILWGTGISVLAGRADIKKLYDRFHDFPKISIGLVVEGTPSIILDNYNGMYNSCVHLFERHQCRRIAFIRGPENHLEAENRFKGYKDALAELGLSFDPEIVVDGNFKRDSGNAGIKTLLDDRKVKFDAILTANDLSAIGAIEELQNRGVRIPDDIRIIGFDNIEESKDFRISLTTVNQPFYEMGEMSLNDLLLLMDNKKLPEITTIPAELVERESCGCSKALKEQATAWKSEVGRDNQQKNISDQRDKIFDKITSIIDASGIGDSIDKHSAGIILDAFINEIENKVKGDFLNSVNRILIKANTIDGINSYHLVLSSLRYVIIPFISYNTDTLIQAETLWQQCRILICEYSQRLTASYRSQDRKQNEILQDINKRLITTFDIEEFMDIMAEELPRLDIPSCFLSLYADSEQKKSKLMLAYTDGNRIKIDTEKSAFQTVNLAPDGLLPRNRQYTAIIEPLYFKNDQLGFVIFEQGQKESAVYDALQAQLSVAIKGLFLYGEREKLLLNLEDHARKLQATADVLKKSNTELEQFSYIASHDLQEPLRKISIFSERLKEKCYDAVGEQGRDYIKRLQEASGRMHSLVDDLLTYSRLTYKTQPLAKVDLSGIAREILSDLAIQIEQKNADIKIDKLPAVEAEPVQMRQLFQNLISNAIKFNRPEQPPVVRIYGKKIRNSGVDFCEFTVEDNGRGIEKKYFDHIFSLFQHLHRHTKYTGTGIGLAICKKIIDTHKGKITVESVVGEGSRFIVHLPVVQQTGEESINAQYD